MKGTVVETGRIAGEVKRLAAEANFCLREDVIYKTEECLKAPGTNDLQKQMLEVLLENARLAEEKKIAMCQDTGMVMVYLDVGQNVCLTGPDLHSKVNCAVKEAYEENCLRKSIVNDAVKRVNTETNLPAVLHTRIVPGSGIEISVLIKGFGSENKSRCGMLEPTSGREGIVEFCVDTVKKASADACPPYVLGVGVGGSMDTAAFYAKKALFRDIRVANEIPHIASIEKDVLKKVNNLEIGIMGLGGRSTALGVNMEFLPTHIAGLPVAVNISCHALRTKRSFLEAE